jgi:hypothetical protein
MLDFVQRAIEDRGGFGAARLRRQVGDDRARPVGDHVRAQADAVARQHRCQFVAALAQVGQGVAIGELRDAAARGEAEDVGVEQFAVAGVGLEHHLVDVRVLLRVARQADLHARLQHRPQRLRDHAGEAALGDAAVAEAVRLRIGIGIGAGIERHQRVDAEHQVDVALQHHRGVHRPAQRAIDEVAAADLDRRIQAGQGGAGLHRARDRHAVPAGVAEAHRLAAVQVHADHVQRALQLAEIVAAATPGEDLAQEMLDAGVVEDAGRDQPADAGDDVGPARVAAPGQHVAGEPCGQFRERDGASQVFVGGQAQEGFRAEHHVVAVAGDEDPAELGGVHAVGQAGGEERARAHAHVAVQSGQVQALAGLVQGAQCAKFVHRPDRPATGDGQADARGMAAAGVALLGSVQ